MIPYALEQSERSISQNMTIFRHEGTTVPEPLFYHYYVINRETWAKSLLQTQHSMTLLRTGNNEIGL